jgi:hypothetical protein
MSQTLKVDPSKKWSGPMRPYDLVKEIVVAIVVVGILAMGLAALFSSPDEKAVTLKSWSNSVPADFALVATGELAGSTGSAGYGPPYNAAAKGQHFGLIKLQDWAGVRIPINPAHAFVIEPLLMNSDQAAKDAVAIWKAASADQQSKWATAYEAALSKSPNQSEVSDTAGTFGPVPVMISSLLVMAQSGGLDGALTTSDTNLPTNFTKPMLFLADSDGYFGALAAKQHLGGDQWGVMNETGSWPGQSWLWLFSFWYQIDPFKSSENADTIIMLIMGVLTVGLMFVPLLPIVRRIPYKIPVHRLIWKSWYRSSN